MKRTINFGILKLVIIIIVFPFISALAQPAPAKQWDARFGGSDYDELWSLKQTADGGYLLGGNSWSGISGDKTQATQGKGDYWIVKTDANGVKEWDARFGGNSDDFLTSLELTSDGGYILGGYSFSGISGDKTQASQGEYDYWIVKTDADGIKQWDARFGGSKIDMLTSLDQTADGGYILGGSSTSKISGDKTQPSWGENDYWIVKTGANGEKQWDARFGGNDEDHLNSLQQTVDGGYILGGWSWSDVSGDKTQPGWGDGDFWVVKTDTNGVKQWDARFGGSNDDKIYSVEQTDDNGYIFGGYSSSGMNGDVTQPLRGQQDYYMIKTDSNGIKQWDARFGGNKQDWFQSLEQTDDGGYILGGWSYSGISQDKTEESQGEYDYWIVKADVNGAKQWDARFGGNSFDYFTSLKQTTDGGYILGGWSYSGISGDKTQASQGQDDYWIVKIGGETCDAPSNLSVTNITSSSAKLKWDVVAGAEAYKIRYINSSTGETTQKYALGNSKVINGLAPNAGYAWQVKTFCEVTPNVTSDWSVSKTFVTEPLRLEEERANTAVEVYPNPANDYLTITLSSDQPTTLSLFNLLGEKVKEEKVSGDQITLDVSLLPQGLYLVRTGNSVVGKFVKE